MASMQCHKPCEEKTNCHKPCEEKTNYHHENHPQKTTITEKCHDNKASHDHKQQSFTEKVKDVFNHHDDHKTKDNCSTGIAHHGIKTEKKKHGEHHEGHGFLIGHKGHEGHGFLIGHKGHEGHGSHGGHEGHEGHCMPKIHDHKNKMKKNKKKKGDKQSDSSSESDSSSDSDNEKKC